MLRSTFFSAGLFILLIGITLFYVEEIHFKKSHSQEQQTWFRGIYTRMTSVTDRNENKLTPPDWASFSLMSIGSVTMLYAVALPKKQQSS